MNVSEILTAGLAIVSIATLCGLGFMRGTVTSLRERLDDADKDVARYARQRQEDRALIDKQAARIAVLETIVTNDDHWRSLTELVMTHHAAAESYWARAEGMLEQILGETRL